MATERRAAAAALCLLVVLLPSCGSGSGSSQHPSTSSSSAPTASSTPSTNPSSPSRASRPARGSEPSACGTGARAFWLPGPAGSRLEANSVGSGAVAVVFLHQVGSTGMCGFWPYASWLASHYPLRAILVNRCGYGASTCTAPGGDPGIIAQTAPAVAWARAHGARRVSLIGASGGGSDAIEAAAVIPNIAAVVDISGDGTDTGADDRTDALRLRVPAMFAVAPQDSYSPVASLHALYAATPARPKRFLVISELSGVHGWDLLLDPAGSPHRLAAVVAAWIR